MDPNSPLTRQTQDAFQPKITQLYSQLFDLNDDDHQPSEGFWREFFLLKPQKQRFIQILDPLTHNDLIQIQRQTRLFVRKAVAESSAPNGPQNENALENLTAFLAAVLDKKYTNPSIDVIDVLAGLEHIDTVMTDLVNVLDTVLSKTLSTVFRRKAIDNATAVISGAYQTSIATYFIHKDFFQSLVKYVQATPQDAPAALSLLGLLANYNKFEAQNIYQSRMGDYIDEHVMTKLVEGFANTCGDIRDAYAAVQDDVPAQWTIGSTLSYVGLRALTPEAKKPPPPSEEEAKALFNALPGVNAVVILATYTFVQANNIFASQVISTDADDDLESPLAAFLSMTSYLCHHAYRSTRTLHYALLTLFTTRLLFQDPILSKRLSSPDAKITVRLARQRPPHLPYLSSTPRIPTTITFDILTHTLSHNLKKRLSLPLYSATLTILHHILTQLSATRIRLPHHWSYIWLSLISLLRFLTTYSSDLLHATSPLRLADLQSQLLTPLTSILTFSLLRGDNFLPDPPSYDDLFYKLVELSSDNTLSKFKSAYEIATLPPGSSILRRATDALVAIGAHYQGLLVASSSKKQHLRPREVARVIGEGHETVGDVMGAVGKAGSAAGGGVRGGGGGAAGGPGVGGDEEFGHYEKWRESAFRGELKRIVRTVVEDGRVLALQ